MMRGRPFKIYIDEFIRTGNFGAVKPGMMVDEVKRVFPKPDSINPMGNNTYIWLYDRFEFHFIDGELQLLWCDWLDLKSPQKKQFKLERGLLDGDLSIKSVSKILKSWGKQYEAIGYYSDGQLESIIYDFKPMCMYFEGFLETSIDKWTLNAIGATSESFTQIYTAPNYKKLELDF